MQAFKSHWGFHPCDYETFRKIKTLHKRYWETVYVVARWTRWNRKTVHRVGPAPRYCPVFVEEQGHWETFTTPEGRRGCRFHSKTLKDYGILEAYRLARQPADSPETVKPLPISKDQIDQLYAAVEAWHNEKNCS